MGRSVRISENALRWIEAQAEEIARHDILAAQRFTQKIQDAIAKLSEFPRLGPPGMIRGTRTLLIDRRYILTVRERNGELEIAAARSHWQKDSHAPQEILAETSDDEPAAPDSRNTFGEK